MLCQPLRMLLAYRIGCKLEHHLDNNLNITCTKTWNSRRGAAEQPLYPLFCDLDSAGSVAAEPQYVGRPMVEFLLVSCCLQHPNPTLLGRRLSIRFFPLNGLSIHIGGRRASTYHQGYSEDVHRWQLGQNDTCFQSPKSIR